jgi:hypothetical protein
MDRNYGYSEGEIANLSAEEVTSILSQVVQKYEDGGLPPLSKVDVYNHAEALANALSLVGVWYANISLSPDPRMRSARSDIIVRMFSGVNGAVGLLMDTWLGCMERAAMPRRPEPPPSELGS